MPFDLLHRIRWANVARAAAVVFALLLVLAWPRLRAHQDTLPAAVEVTPAVPTETAAATKATRVTHSARGEEAQASRRTAPAEARTAPKRHVTKRHAVKRRHHTRHRTSRRPRIATPPTAPALRYVAPAAGAAPAVEFRP